MKLKTNKNLDDFRQHVTIKIELLRTTTKYFKLYIKIIILISCARVLSLGGSRNVLI